MWFHTLIQYVYKSGRENNNKTEAIFSVWMPKTSLAFVNMKMNLLLFLTHIINVILMIHTMFLFHIFQASWCCLYVLVFLHEHWHFEYWISCLIEITSSSCVEWIFRAIALLIVQYWMACTIFIVVAALQGCGIWKYFRLKCRIFTNKSRKPYIFTIQFLYACLDHSHAIHRMSAISKSDDKKEKRKINLLLNTHIVCVLAISFVTHS